ncbi:hypothetical protein LEMLEM_LOCUS4847, partial [Lemmus lemmus]
MLPGVLLHPGSPEAPGKEAGKHILLPKRTLGSFYQCCKTDTMWPHQPPQTSFTC